MTDTHTHLEIEESDTETSELYLQQHASLDNEQTNSKKQKKKIKSKAKTQVNMSMQEQNRQNPQTLKKKKSRRVLSEQGQIATVRKMPKKPAYNFDPTSSQKQPNPNRPSYQCCAHSSVYRKLFISIILSMISIALFKEPPKINYPLAEFEEGEHQAVFEITTDRKTRYIQFNLQIEKQIGFLTSTKVGRVKAAVNYTLGYKFQSKSRGPRGNSMHSVVEMSNLEILDYKISDVVLQNQQDGLLNSWQFRDYQNLVSYIKDKHIKQMERQVLTDITDQRRKMYESKAKLMLTDIIDKSESWFHWLLKRIDKYIDVGLEPYVRNVEIAYNEDKELEGTDEVEVKEESI